MDHAIAHNLDDLRARIERAAHVAGRDPGTICLVAVSKRHPPSAIRAAYAVGQRDFGENYVQELQKKAEELADLPDLRWHMIGHLQSNKARAVAPIACCVHTVDSTYLAAELGRRARKGTRLLQVLVEVNVAGEASKSGCSPSELEQVIEAVKGEAGLELRGLMTIPPLHEEASANRRYFAALRGLQYVHGGAAALPELSMGMSGDFEVAIAEGATIVRVGTAIFGPRVAEEG